MPSIYKGVNIMKNLILILAIAGVFNYVDEKQNVPDWSWFSPEFEEFAVEFPNLQTVETKDQGMESMGLDGSNYISKMPLGLLKFDNIHCEVFFGEFSQGSYETVDVDRDRLKSHIKKEFLANLVSERDIEWLGYSAEEYVFESKVSKTRATVRTVYDRSQNKFAQLIFAHPKKGNFKPEMERFFGSFEMS
jgi:hypothetical protein